jgi:hypothetical protein
MPDTARKNNSALDQPFEFEFEGAPQKINQGKSDKIVVHIRSKQYEGYIDLTAQALHSSGEKNHGAIVSVHPTRVRISPKSPASAIAHVSLDPKALSGKYRLGITAKSVRRVEKEKETNSTNTSVSRNQTENTDSKIDESWGDFFKHAYLGQVGEVFKGYGDTVNVFKAVDGGKQLVTFARSHGALATGALVIKGTVHAYTAFATTSDPREFGQSFGTVLETAIPFAKKIPTPALVAPIGEYEAQLVVQGADAAAVFRATRKISNAGATFVARGRISKALRQAYKTSGEKLPNEKQSHYGTTVHTELKNQLVALGKNNIKPEVSFRKNIKVTYGDDESVRLDIIIKTKDGQILAVYDLKTGKATFTQKRIQKIISQLPEKSKQAIFRELRKR